MREPQRLLRPVGTTESDREYVEFWPAGVVAAGRFRCTACGNVANVKYVVPGCLLCGERLWEREESSPYVPDGGVVIR